MSNGNGVSRGDRKPATPDFLGCVCWCRRATRSSGSIWPITSRRCQPVAGATAPDEKLMRSPAMVSSECSVRMSSTGTEK